MGKTYKKLIANNKKAFHNYTITEKLETGIMLKGHEVKSLRAGNAAIKESYVRIMHNQLWLLGCHIPPYENINSFSELSPTRNRKLLIHKKELSKLIKLQIKGFSFIPIQLYFYGNHAKLQIGIGKAKKLHDIRETLKKRQVQRDLDRHQ